MTSEPTVAAGFHAIVGAARSDAPAPGAGAPVHRVDVPVHRVSVPADGADAPALPPFDTVLATHEVELYRYLRRLVPSPEDAADLHQETFLRAFRAYDRLEAGANVRAWLYRIAGNLARDAHRRRVVREPGRGGSLTEDEPRDGANDPAARAEAAEFRDAVRAALLRLPERQRLAVVARSLEGQAYADVASALGCSEQAARQHVSQGLRRIRTILERWMEVKA